jgi:hypothetical protein
MERSGSVQIITAPKLRGPKSRIRTRNAIIEQDLKGVFLVQQPEDGELWVPDQGVPATPPRA